MKYHINDKGNPGVCRAKHRCRFGDINTEHYSSKEEARAAFETMMKESAEEQLASYSNTKVKNNEVIESSSVFKNFGVVFEEVDEEFALELEEEFGDDLYIGSYSEWSGPEAANAGALMKTASEDLLLELSSFDGFNPPGDFYDEGSGVEFDAAVYGDFKLLGSGYSRNAYLHSPTGMVYKVPNMVSAGREWSDDEADLQKKLVILDQKAYALLDDEKLSEDGYEYVKTYFLTAKDINGSEVPVVIQPYLSEEEYEQVSLTTEEESKLSRVHPLDDLKSANIRRRKSDGKIILFDCLSLPLDEEF